MKKIITLLIVVATTCMLTACGGDSKSSEVKSNDILSFKSGTTEIIMNDDASSALNSLGEAKSSFREESCAGLGYEITYKYPGFELVTYQKQEGDKEFVLRVFFIDDTVSTTEGIRLGDSSQKVVDTYSTGSATDVQIEVKKGNCTLSFILENQSVKSIEYMANDVVSN